MSAESVAYVWEDTEGALVQAPAGPITREQHFTCIYEWGEDYAHTDPYFWHALTRMQLGHIDGIDRGRRKGY